MKTLADLKRTLKPGTQLEVTAHWMAEHIGTVRTVTKAQGNGYWYVVAGDDKRKWGSFPESRKQLSFPTPDTFRVDGDKRSGQCAEFPEGRFPFYALRVLETIGELPKPGPVIRRTFEAKRHAPGSPERARLNLDTITSEYYPSKRYAVKEDNGNGWYLFPSLYRAHRHVEAKLQSKSAV